MKSKKQKNVEQKKVEVEKHKALATPFSPEEVLEYLGTQCKTVYDPDFILKEVEKELVDNSGKQEMIPASNLYKSMTLFEFEKGILLVSVIPEMYRTFAIDLSRKLQAEFDCQTPSGKATAELAALNFVRTMEIQRKIVSYLVRDTISEISVRYLAVLSKELDRANRHYLTAVQVLKTMNQPPFSVNVKTQTAVIGQNQIVQAKND
jgi:hypothetical protein